jgi:ribosomal protein L11 methyltransferase
MGRVQSTDVGARLRLVPYWERGTAKSDRIELIIDPGPSFGTGEHPTTIMALELLELAVGKAKDVGPSPAMLDVGTGTGVLAIAGKALGTGFTVGLDVDPAAVFIARRNVELNGSSNLAPGQGNASVELMVGGAECIKTDFDIVAANLAAPTLLNLRDNLVAASGLFLVLSGIADAMAEEVIRSYESAGLLSVMRKRREEWNAVLWQKRHFGGNCSE